MAISDDLIYTTIPRDPPDPSLSASGDCLLNQSCFLDGVDEPGAFFLESFEKPCFPKMDDFLENFQTACDPTTPYFLKRKNVARFWGQLDVCAFGTFCHLFMVKYNLNIQKIC